MARLLPFMLKAGGKPTNDQLALIVCDLSTALEYAFCAFSLAPKSTRKDIAWVNSPDKSFMNVQHLVFYL